MSSIRKFIDQTSLQLYLDMMRYAFEDGYVSEYNGVSAVTEWLPEDWGFRVQVSSKGHKRPLLEGFVKAQVESLITERLNYERGVSMAS